MDKQSRMYKIVSGYDASQKDRASYSADHGITLNMFCYWRKKWLSDQKKQNLAQRETSFVPILPSPEEKVALSSSSSAVLELEYSNGVVLRLFSPDISLVKELLRINV